MLVKAAPVGFFRWRKPIEQNSVPAAGASVVLHLISVLCN